MAYLTDARTCVSAISAASLLPWFYRYEKKHVRLKRFTLVYSMVLYMLRSFLARAGEEEKQNQYFCGSIFRLLRSLVELREGFGMRAPIPYSQATILN